MKNFLAVIFIVASLGLFFYSIDPTYREIKTLRVQEAEFSEALENTERVQDLRSELQAKYNSFSQDDHDRLEKLLPDVVDTVRLIIEINAVAVRYGIELKDVKVSSGEGGGTAPSAGASTAGQKSPAIGTKAAKPYEGVPISFAVSGSYEDFLGFLSALERSLRIIDITDLSIVPKEKSQDYEYTIGIRTYRLLADAVPLSPLADAALAGESRVAANTPTPPGEKSGIAGADAPVAARDGHAVLDLLNSMSLIRLDETFFSDPLFVKLTDWSVVLQPEPKGRKNPFAPIGTDENGN